LVQTKQHLFNQYYIIIKVGVGR